MKKQTKKAILLNLISDMKIVPLEEAAMLLYGGDDELSKLKVIRLLSAYRAKKDTRFNTIRVRQGKIVIIDN